MRLSKIVFEKDSENEWSTQHFIKAVNAAEFEAAEADDDDSEEDDWDDYINELNEVEAEKVKKESTETKVKEESVNKGKKETLLSPVTKSKKKVLRITDIGWPKNRPTIKKWENLGS